MYGPYLSYSALSKRSMDLYLGIAGENLTRNYLGALDLQQRTNLKIFSEDVQMLNKLDAHYGAFLEIVDSSVSVKASSVYHRALSALTHAVHGDTKTLTGGIQSIIKSFEENYLDFLGSLKVQLNDVNKYLSTLMFALVDNSAGEDDDDGQIPRLATALANGINDALKSLTRFASKLTGPELKAIGNYQLDKSLMPSIILKKKKCKYLTAVTSTLQSILQVINQVDLWEEDGPATLQGGLSSYDRMYPYEKTQFFLCLDEFLVAMNNRPDWTATAATMFNSVSDSSVFGLFSIDKEKLDVELSRNYTKAILVNYTTAILGKMALAKQFNSNIFLQHKQRIQTVFSKYKNLIHDVTMQKTQQTMEKLLTNYGKMAEYVLDIGPYFVKNDTILKTYFRNMKIWNLYEVNLEFPKNPYVLSDVSSTWSSSMNTSFFIESRSDTLLLKHTKAYFRPISAELREWFLAFQNVSDQLLLSINELEKRLTAYKQYETLDETFVK